MKNKAKENKINARKTRNGKYYTKLNNQYIGYLNEKELNQMKKELNLLSNQLTPEQLINYFRSLFVDIKKGLKISKGMQQNKYKQYNKKLEIKTIKKIKAIAKHYNLTENETITQLINKEYNKLYSL